MFQCWADFVREAPGSDLKAPKTVQWNLFAKTYKWVVVKLDHEAIFRLEKNGTTWIPIWYSVGPSMIKRQCDYAIKWYMSTSQFVMKDMDADQKSGWSAPLPAVLDMWIGWIATFLNLDWAWASFTSCQIAATKSFWLWRDVLPNVCIMVFEDWRESFHDTP